MDFTDYLTSKDVAAYLKDIKYVFSPLEAAQIIWKSKKTIKEKQTAFKYIIDEMPDCELIYSQYYWKSIKDFIREHIALQDKYINRFFEKSNAIYESFCDELNGIGNFDLSFSSLDECLKHAEKTENEAAKIGLEKKYSSIRITKKWLNSDKAITLTLDRNNEIISLQVCCLGKKRERNV